MLTEIRLKNFKCFREETPFPLSKINLLTGINGRGKSTLLQSILLMKQSVEHDEYTDKIILNGNCVELGDFKDVKNSFSTENSEILIGFSFEKKDKSLELGFFCIKYKLNNILSLNQLKIDYKYDEDEYHDILTESEYGYKSNMVVSYIDIDEKDLEKILLTSEYGNVGYNNAINLRQLFPFFQQFDLNIHEDYAYEVNEKYNLSLPSDIETYNEISEDINFNSIHYISADRLGSKKYYEKITLPKFIHVDKKGENVASVLLALAENKVYDELYLGEDAKDLLTQTGEWLSKILDTSVRIEPKKDLPIIPLFFEIGNTKFLPTNVGFGYSYVLPIVVSGLIAKEGEILIIENPEAHLHPKAQNELTKFLAKVASCGVQVFLESHSEHILNALRVVTIDKPKSPQILEKEDVNILYFDSPDGHFEQIPILENGAIEKWLPDFFDQTDKDFEILFGI